MDDANLPADGAAETPTKHEIPQKNPGYWQRWIEGARKSADRHINDARAAWKEYELQSSIQIEGAAEKATNTTYPAYWSRVKTLESAYYSRTPKERSKRAYDIDHEVVLTMALIAERLARHRIRNTSFDSTMRAAASDYIHASRTTVQVLYDVDTEERQTRIPVAPGSVPDEYLDQSGSPIPLDVEVFQDEQGLFILQNETVTTRKNTRLAAAPYDEVLHTPDAKSFDEIREVAIYFCMPETQARSRFGKGPDGKERNLPLKTSSLYRREKGEEDDTSIPGKFLEGWECWCLETKTVYWISLDFKEFLDEKPDPYKLRRFFPIAPFAIDSQPSKSLYPTPAYIHLRPTLDQLHTLWDRFFDLLDGARRRCLVDGSNEDLMKLVEADDQEFIAVENMALIAKEGFDKLIYYLPVAPLVECIKELSAVEEKLKLLVDEWFGTPEVMRGVSDPVETAGGLELKSNNSSDRFKYSRKQIADLARDGVEMMVDLDLQVLADDEVKRICCFDFLPEPHQQRFPEALSRLRNDTERLVRLELETDSTSFANEQEQLRRSTLIGQTILNGLGAIGGMQNIEFMDTALKVLLTTLDSIPGASQEFQDGVKSAVKMLAERKNTPPQGPPPVDYKGLELKLREQELALEAQVKGRELDQKDFKLRIEAQKQQSDQRLAEFRLATDTEISKLLASLEVHRVEIEKLRAEVFGREKASEEARLAYETQMEASRPPEPKESGPETVIINSPGGAAPAVPIISPGV